MILFHSTVQGTNESDVKLPVFLGKVSYIDAL